MKTPLLPLTATLAVLGVMTNTTEIYRKKVAQPDFFVVLFQ